MNKSSGNLRSIEDMTIRSLNDSAAGLKALCRDSVLCAELLFSDIGNAMERFNGLAANIRKFYVFENDVRSTFGIKGEDLRDAAGNLTDADSALCSVMDDMIGRLDKRDFAALAEILKIGVPAVLDRFISLLPLLRQHIQNEQLTTT
jgi:hypothetical protein